MKKYLLSLLCAFAALTVAAQDKEISRDVIDRLTDSVKNEGRALYRSEWASWYGTDIFLEKCPQKRSLIGGYISYETPNTLVNVFYSKDEVPKAIGITTFDKSFDPKAYTLDTVVRDLQPQENELVSLRKDAQEYLRFDTIVKKYRNTDLNVVPFIYKGVKKVYVLTAPQQNGVVIFGNDYLITFNKGARPTVRTLHKTLQYQQYANTTSAMHSHLPETGDIITPTDICTLMLYGHLTPWKTYTVISKNLVSAWDVEKNDMAVLTIQAWKRITDDVEKRRSKND